MPARELLPSWGNLNFFMGKIEENLPWRSFLRKLSQKGQFPGGWIMGWKFYWNLSMPNRFKYTLIFLKTSYLFLSVPERMKKTKDHFCQLLAFKKSFNVRPINVCTTWLESAQWRNTYTLIGSKHSRESIEVKTKS